MEGLSEMIARVISSPEGRKSLSVIKLNIQSQIFEIVFYGKGGYSYETVYNMPIWLRKYTFFRIKDYYEKEAEEIEKAKKGQSSSKPKVPDVVNRKVPK